MKRAFVFAVLVIAFFAGRPVADAQSLTPVPRIGVLRFAGASGQTDLYVESIRQGLRELGYVEGKNIAIEWRFAEGRKDRAATLAAELVRLRVAVIVTSGTPAAEAAKSATRSIPIVLAGVADAVGSGFVASLAQPGGNITGLSLNFPETAGKQLEWLRQMLPGISRVAFLASNRDPAAPLIVEETRRAGERLGIRLQVLTVGGAEDFDGAFGAMRREQAGALIIQPIFSDQTQRIAELALRNRLPTASFNRGFAEAGALMSYGPDLRELWRRTAIYVDKILKGAKPRELPVAEPTKYELVINLKTAKALGLTIPQSLLGRADAVIQ
jgi:putative tryptophan/tyrosine transport system substrate-binding protein